MSDDAVEVLREQLTAWPEADVRKALDRCVRECRGALRYADILSRLPGAAPTADEAWAIAARGYDEGASVVWTDAIAVAFGEVRHMSDRVAARMAFRAAYDREASQAPPGPALWWASFGHDAGLRATAVDDAIRAGRLGEGARAKLLGSGTSRPALPARASSDPVSVAEMVASVRQLKGGGDGG